MWVLSICTSDKLPRHVGAGSLRTTLGMAGRMKSPFLKPSNGVCSEDILWMPLRFYILSLKIAIFPLRNCFWVRLPRSFSMKSLSWIHKIRSHLGGAHRKHVRSSECREMSWSKQKSFLASINIPYEEWKLFSIFRNFSWNRKTVTTLLKGQEICLGFP